MNYDLLIKLHQNNHRQGPGGDAETRRALALSGLLDSQKPLKIADIGCGTGASTKILAENLDAEIAAVDLFPTFLEKINHDKIKTLACSMDDLPFEKASLDAIWSEGAIYNMGFAKGVEYFKEFLKPGGILAVSEITWLSYQRPDEINRYWHESYPEIACASQKIKVLEENGYALLGYFPLPEQCWLENYYDPLEKTFDYFVMKYGQEAREIVANEQKEIKLYKTYKDYYSYGFYIAKKI